MKAEEIRDFTDSTGLIGQPEALRARWEEEGYIFVRGVLPAEDIAKWRQKFLEILRTENLVSAEGDDPTWTGAPQQTDRLADKLGTAVWTEIVKDAALNEIVGQLLGEPPFWIPIVSHRAALPHGPGSEDRYAIILPHQDGFFNEGMNFTTCWIPLMDLDRTRGGLALGSGSHRMGSFHDAADPHHRAMMELYDDAGWRTADFKVGDVLIFDFNLLHSALVNRSDTIRLSIDVRCVPQSAPKPVVGSVLGVKDNRVTIEQDEGLGPRTVQIDGNTFIRHMHPLPSVPLERLGDVAYPGARVLAMTDEAGHATVLRPNKF